MDPSAEPNGRYRALLALHRDRRRAGIRQNPLELPIAAPGRFIVLDGAGSWGANPARWPPGFEEGRLPARPRSFSSSTRPCPRHGPQSLADGFRPPAQIARRAQVLSTARAGRMSRPPPGATRFAGGGSSTRARRSARDRRLRRGRRGDTVEAIAPDAAALRSRHVARRMDCGSSWTLLRITAVAVVDVGRAQVAARCAGDSPKGKAPNCSFPFTARCFAAIAP